MLKLAKISSLLLIISISLLFIGKFNFLGPIKISDYFIILSFLFFTFSILKKEIKISLKNKIFKYIIISLIFIIIGTLSSIIFIKDFEKFNIIKGYYHLGINLLYIIEIFILSRYDNNLIKKIFYSFLVSLSIVPLIYFPQISKHLLYAGSRFQGLLNDPNYFANFQIIPTIILLWLIQKDNTNNIIRVLLSILFFFSIGLILWSGSRSGLLGISASLISFIVLMFINKNPIKKIILLLLLVIVAFPVGYNLMPKNSHKNIEVRLGYITENIDKNTESKKSYKNINSENVIKKISGNQDRINIWIDSVHFIRKNPLGYGPGYNQIVNIRGDGGQNRVSHNTILEILLIGGVGFLIIFLIILINIFKNIKNQENYYLTILQIIITGILISSMFLDTTLYSKWLWISITIYYSIILKSNFSINPKQKTKNNFL